MKAIVYNEYGAPDVLRLAEVAKPEPKAGEVLIRVRAATVTTGDVNMRGFTFVPPGFGFLPRLMFGINKPNKPVLGTELAGDVVAVGPGVTEFDAGDRVFGIDSGSVGAYAEYACRPAKGALALIPAGVGYEDAASIPFGAGTALYFLRDVANVQPGQTVLVNGASGGVGAYAVQLARYLGAQVSGVCSSRNLELVQSLGADAVIDYTVTDFAATGQQYDVIVDTVVGKSSFERCRPALKADGKYLAVAGGPRQMLQSLGNSLRGGQKVLAGSPPERKQELEFLAGLLESGHIKPVIDRSYPLERTAEAHRYVDSGRKRGSVVITVALN